MFKVINILDYNPRTSQNIFVGIKYEGSKSPAQQTSTVSLITCSPVNAHKGNQKGKETNSM